MTATNIANHVRLNPKASIKGKIIGTIIMTIGTHSNGHPNKKITAITIAKIKYLFISRPNKKSVSNIGVPNLEKTAPKKFEAATKTMIKAEIYKVFTSESWSFFNVNFLYAIANNNDPIAPQPAASVGVAKPNKILPSAAKTNAAGGTSPKKNSIQTCFMLVALSSGGNTGPNFGLIIHLTVV